MGVVQSTLDNLKTAIEGETHEFKEMYPAMIKDAVADKEIEARHSLEYAMSIEMMHAKFFKAALDNPQANADAVYYVCPVCGNTVRKRRANVLSAGSMPKILWRSPNRHPEC
jgi:rubrerythrin